MFSYEGVLARFLLCLRKFWLPARNLRRYEMRGEICVEDNDDLLVRRVVSWMGLEGTDASSAVATC
ncbi:hypothetical protein A2U01_0067578, partial [Trifolium medium]|nr:hypothetical protein [Trifolium medium]